MNDNELGILELIHLFVEVLDGYFGNVCELDLVFHFDKVRVQNPRSGNLCVAYLSKRDSKSLSMRYPFFWWGIYLKNPWRSTGYWTSSFSLERSPKPQRAKS